MGAKYAFLLSAVFLLLLAGCIATPTVNIRAPSANVTGEEIARSQQHWQAEAFPFAITNHSISERGMISVYLKNRDAKALQLSQISVGTAIYMPGGISFAPNETRLVSWDTSIWGKPGDFYSKSVEITYYILPAPESPRSEYQRETGAEPIIGKYG